MLKDVIKEAEIMVTIDDIVEEIRYTLDYLLRVGEPQKLFSDKDVHDKLRELYELGYKHGGEDVLKFNTTNPFIVSLREFDLEDIKNMRPGQLIRVKGH